MCSGEEIAHQYVTAADLQSSWNGRIPFVILFSIATSVDLFQAKFSQKAIRRLDGAEFTIEKVDIEEVFQAINHSGSSLWLGPSLSSLILQQQRDYIQSSPVVRESVKVSLVIRLCQPSAYMV